MKVFPTTIDHATREDLGLSVVDWAVADFYDQLNGQDLSNKEIATFLGISPTMCSQSRALLHGLAMLEESEPGKFVTTDLWRSQRSIQFNLVVTKGVWEEYVEFYNREVATPLRLPQIMENNKTARGQVLSILKALPEMKPFDLRLVTMFKKHEWGSEDKMKKHIHPRTIFSSSARFQQYHSDAMGWYKTISK